MLPQNNRDYLEKILNYAVGKVNASDEADKITNAFSSVTSIANKSPSVLQNLSECSEQTAEFIRLVVSLTSRRVTDEFRNGKKYARSDIERYLCAMLFHLSVENVYMLSFDKNGKLISTDSITEGTVNSSAFLPRKVADLALKRKAHSVIIAHNHPSGNPMPSDNDIAVTMLAESVLNDAHVRLDAHYITVGFTIYDCLKTVKRSADESSEIKKVEFN